MRFACLQLSKRPQRDGLNGDASFASLGTTFGHLLQTSESPRTEDVAVLKVCTTAEGLIALKLLNTRHEQDMSPMNIKPSSDHNGCRQDALRRSEAARKRAYRDARAAKEELHSLVHRQSLAAQVVQGNQALLDKVPTGSAR